MTVRARVCVFVMCGELCVDVHVHTQLHARLVCLHAVQLTCVLDMCNTFTKHNGSRQVVRVGAADPRVFLLEILVFSAIKAKIKVSSHG